MPRLEVDLQPKPQAPSLQLHFSLPHTAPDGVEQQATAPLENALSGLRGIKHIRSTSRYHGGEITLEFKEGTDLAFQRLEVAGILQQLCVVFTKQACPTCIRVLCNFAEKQPQPEQLRVFAYGFRSEKDLRLALGKPCLELLRPKHFPDFPKDVEEYDYGNVYFWLIENQKSIHFTELTPWLLGNEFVELLGFLKGTMWQK